MGQTASIILGWELVSSLWNEREHAQLIDREELLDAAAGLFGAPSIEVLRDWEKDARDILAILIDARCFLGPGASPGQFGAFLEMVLCDTDEEDVGLELRYTDFFKVTRGGRQGFVRESDLTDAERAAAAATGLWELAD